MCVSPLFYRGLRRGPPTPDTREQVSAHFQGTSGSAGNAERCQPVAYAGDREGRQERQACRFAYRAGRGAWLRPRLLVCLFVLCCFLASESTSRLCASCWLWPCWPLCLALLFPLSAGAGIDPRLRICALCLLCPWCPCSARLFSGCSGGVRRIRPKLRECREPLNPATMGGF